MINSSVDLIKPYVQDYESVSEQLTSKWSENKRVVDTLAKHKISHIFFKNHFGTKIYDYFISIIKDDKEADNCPYVHVFLHFCVDKKIKLNEIYIICSELKNVVVEYFIKNHKNENNEQVYWQIVDLMDSHFAGVVAEFIATRYDVSYDTAQNNISYSSKSSNVAISDAKHSSSTDLKVKLRLENVRSSKQEKYDSASLFEMFGEDIFDKIELFIDELNEMILNLYDIEEADPEESYRLMHKVNLSLDEFYRLIDTLVVFPVVVNTFKNLALFLTELKVEDYANKAKKELVMYLIWLVKDLENWISIVFIERKAQDVHYFDASFANNVTEIESIFNGQSIIDDKGVLEFF